MTKERSSSRRGWRIAAAACALGLGLLAIVRCVEHAEGPRTARSATQQGDGAAATRAEGAAPSAATAANARGDRDPEAPAGATPAAAEPAASPTGAAEPADNAVARMMQRTDAADRALLADIEQKTHAPPPPAIHTLLAMRRRGASHDELSRFIEEALASELIARLEAARWLREISGGPKTEDAGAAIPTTGPLGTGGGTRRVQPLSPAPASPKP